MRLATSTSLEVNETYFLHSGCDMFTRRTIPTDKRITARIISVVGDENHGVHSFAAMRRKEILDERTIPLPTARCSEIKRNFEDSQAAMREVSDQRAANDVKVRGEVSDAR